MATITIDIPVAAPATGVTLTSLVDATSGSTIALPGTVAFNGPAVVGSYNQWLLAFSAPLSVNVTWAGVVQNLDGSTSPISGTTAGDATVVSGYYASLPDLYDLFGQMNVNTWSNLDGGNTLVPSRALRALIYADNEINQFYSGVVGVPLPINSTTTYWGAGIAGGGWLYGDRGQLDKGGRKNKYAIMVEEIYTDMLNYKAGIKQFPGATFTASLAPSVSGGSQCR